MKKNYLKKLICLATLFAFTLTLTSCGNNAENTTDKNTEKTAGESSGEDSSNSITFVLDWTPNTNHTGIYVALDKGYFTDAGLDVSVVQPPDNGATDMVASGGAQFGIDFQDTLAAAFGTENPLPVTAVAAVLQHNTSGLVSLAKKGIDSPGKLEDHSYATWDSPIEQAILKNVVEGDGGDFSKVNLISTYVEDIVAGLNSDIDCVWIYEGWDGVKLELENYDVNYLPFSEMNPIFDYYSPVIIANNDYLESNPEQAKAFLAAVKKGYEYAAENVEEATDILLAAAPELDETLVYESQGFLSKEYISDSASWGIIDPKRWNDFYSFLNENGLVEQEIPENAGFSMDYLG